MIYHEIREVDGLLVHVDTRIYLHDENSPVRAEDPFCVGTVYLRSPQWRANAERPWGPDDDMAVLGDFAKIVPFLRLRPTRLQKPYAAINAYLTVGYLVPTHYVSSDRWDLSRVVDKLLDAGLDAWWTPPQGFAPITFGWGVLEGEASSVEDVLQGRLLELQGYRRVGPLHAAVRRSSGHLIVRNRYVGRGDRMDNLQILDPGRAIKTATALLDLEQGGRTSRRDLPQVI